MSIVDLTSYPNTHVPLNPIQVFRVPTVWVEPAPYRFQAPDTSECYVATMKVKISGGKRIPALRPEEV